VHHLLDAVGELAAELSSRRQPEVARELRQTAAGLVDALRRDDPVASLAAVAIMQRLQADAELAMRVAGPIRPALRAEAQARCVAQLLWLPPERDAQPPVVHTEPQPTM
jgi:hypothetical protein